MTRRGRIINKSNDKSSSIKKKKNSKSKIINKKSRLIRVGDTWKRKKINDNDDIKNKPKRLVRDGNTWRRKVSSINETVLPQQNDIPQQVKYKNKKGSIDAVSQMITLNNKLPNLETSRAEMNRSLYQNSLIDTIDINKELPLYLNLNNNGKRRISDLFKKEEEQNFSKNSKKLKPSIENNLYRYKLSQNTFLPVGFEIAEEILGYLDIEDLISVSLTYKPIHKFIMNSEKLWQELYKELSSESINSIMKPLILIQSLASPGLKPSIAWKRQVFNRLKYRPFYLAFTYMDDSNDFTISFLGVSYDLSTVQIEAYQYATYEEESNYPANFVQHNTQIFDSLQEGFDEWRIAIESIKTDLTKSLKLKENDEMFIVYSYMDVKSNFQFNFLKLFDNENEAIKFAKSLSDLDDNNNYAKNINHSGEIFDCKQKFIKDSRIAIDIVKFWSKIHQNRNLPNSFIEEDDDQVIKGKGKEREETEEEDMEDGTNFIEKWRQMGLMDKTYIQEVIDDIINKSNQKKRSLEDSILDMESSKLIKHRRKN